MKPPGWYPPEDGGPIAVYWDGQAEETVGKRLELVCNSHLVSMIPRLTAQFETTKAGYIRKEFTQAGRRARGRFLIRRFTR